MTVSDPRQSKVRGGRIRPQSIQFSAIQQIPLGVPRSGAVSWVGIDCGYGTR
jgi:hypothetical protein